MTNPPPSPRKNRTQGRFATRILYIDHDRERRSTAVAAVRAAGDSISVTAAASGSAAQDPIRDGVDGVVVVHDPPAVDAAALVETIERMAPGLPTVVRVSAPEMSGLSDRLATVTDYYLVDADSDPLVADRITGAASDRDRVVHGPSPTVLLDDDGHVLDANDTARGVLGIHSLGSGTDIDDAAWVQTGNVSPTEIGALVDQASAGETVTFETVLERDGTEFVIEGTLRPLQAGGTVDRIVLQADPIGGEQDWAAIVDRMTDAFFSLDRSWQVTYLNEEAARVVGAAMGDSDAVPETLEGRQFWDNIPGSVDTAFHEEFTAAMDDQETRSFTEYYEPLGSWFDVNVYPSATGVSVYFRDVTERRAQRERLQARERTIREVYTTVADADQSFHEQVRSLLNICCEALDVSYGTLSRVEGDEYVFEVVEAPSDTIAAGDSVALAETNCERAVTTEQSVVIADLEHERPDLTDRAGYAQLGIECYIGAPVFLDGRVYGTFCFYDDTPRETPFTDWERTLVDLLGQWVSSELDREHTRERLRAQNDRLEQFASIVSHDLRNPLDVAINRVDLLSVDEDNDHVAAIQRSHERMASLIDDLLLLAHEGTESSDPTPVAIDVVAGQGWDQVDTTGATLRIETDSQVLADAGHLQRMLENLFRNAMVHGRSDAETPITVTVETTDDGFRVADDGRGIGVDDPDSLFESGYTTTEDGTGLGLAIVDRLADLHGWTVTASSGDDGGARIEFSDVEFHD